MSRTTDESLAQQTVRPACPEGCWQPPGGGPFDFEVAIPGGADQDDLMLVVWSGLASDDPSNALTYPLRCPPPPPPPPLSRPPPPQGTGAPGRIRTCDLPLRRRLLCPLSYGDVARSLRARHRVWPGHDPRVRNWAGNLEYRARRFHRADVRRAAPGDRPRDPRSDAGSRHSFNDIADTTGDLVSLATIEMPRDVGDGDRSGTRRAVTVDGGIRMASCVSTGPRASRSTTWLVAASQVAAWRDRHARVRGSRGSPRRPRSSALELVRRW